MKNYFEVSDVPVKKIRYKLGMPKTIKAVCGNNGSFCKLGEDEGQKSIKMQVLRTIKYPNTVLFYDPANGERPAPTDYLQVIYVNERGEVCATLLKNESKDNYETFVQDIEIDSDNQKTAAFFTIIATMKSCKSKDGFRYSSVTFSMGTELAPENVKKNAELMKEPILCFRTALEYVKAVNYDRQAKGKPEFEYSIDMVTRILEKFKEITPEHTTLLRDNFDTNSMLALPEPE